MRVLFLSVSAGFGGAERVLLDTIAALGQLHPDWPIGVVCLAEGPLAAELAGRGVDVFVLPMPRRFAALGESGRSTAHTVAGLAGNAWALRAYTRTLRAAMAAWRPDVVHANGLKAHVLAAWAAPSRARIVWHVHDYISARRVSSVLLRSHERRAAVVVANSESVAADVRSVLGRGTRVAVVHNGIDTKAFVPNGRRLDIDEAAGLPAPPAGTIRVGLVATYARWKGHETFLRAFSRLCDLPVRGYIVGGALYETTGSQYSREELESVVRALDLVGRIGFVPFQREVAPVFRSLDIAVHASTRPEPFGLAVLEAMACGRPLVVSNTGGVCELVADGSNALTHAAGDAHELADRIAHLTRDPGLRERLGANARRRAVDVFGRERLGLAISDIYESLAHGDRNPVLLSAVGGSVR
jgi:glycosyltransferase involved in cell wall biosynthesis